jgi:hypothetical protein
MMNAMNMAFVPDAYPGFNNTLNEGANQPWVVLPRNASSFGEMLDTAMNYRNSSLGIVMVTSWNEWMEGTMIEPSTKEGETFLNIVYSVALDPEIPQSTISPSPWLLIMSIIFGAIVGSRIVTFLADAAHIRKRAPSRK